MKYQQNVRKVIRLWDNQILNELLMMSSRFGYGIMMSIFLLFLGTVK